MATRTFVSGGASKNWSDTTAWAEGIVPTAADDVVFTAGSGTLTIDGTSGSPSLCRSFDATGYTGTLTHAATKYLNIGDGTQGHFTLVSGMTYSPSATSFLRFVSTTTGNLITFGGKNLGSVIFNGAGGEWLFNSAASFANGTVTLTSGTLDFNNQTSTWAGGTFNASGTTTRALKLGTATATLQAAMTWDITDSTNLTLTPSTSTLSFTTTSQSAQFIGGGLTYATLSATVLSTGSLTITGANTFSTLTLSCSSNAASTHILGANQTVTGTFTSNGNSVINRTFIRSNVKGTARTITAATVTVTNIDLQDITGAGAGSWDLSAVTGGSGDAGGNSGITFTTPVNRYWVASGGTSTGAFSATTRWASSSGGAGGSTSPLPQDAAFVDANSIDAGSRILTNDKRRMGSLDFTGVTNTPEFAKSTPCSFFGNITLSNSITQTGTAAITIEKRSAATFTPGSTTFTNPLVIDTAGNTVTLGNNLTSSGSLTLASGTLAAGAYTSSWTTLTASGGDMTISANATFTATPTISGTSTLTATSASFIFGTTLTITGAGSGGGLAANPMKGFIV